MAARAAAETNVARGSLPEHLHNEIGRIDLPVRGQVFVTANTLIGTTSFASS